MGFIPGPPQFGGGGGGGSLNDAYNFGGAGAGRIIVTTGAGDPVEIQGVDGLVVDGPIIANLELRAGDLSFSDPVCANCDDGFSEGQPLSLSVRDVKMGKDGKPITYTVPIHSICPGG